MSSCQTPVNVSASGLSENHEAIINWVLATISWTVAPLAILLNALVIIAVTQRKELQKHSNILLSSIALSDMLTGIASIPAVTKVKYIWTTILNVCVIANVVTIVYFYAMIYHGVRNHRTSDLKNVNALAQARLESRVAKTTALITAALLLTIAVSGILVMTMRLKFPTSRPTLAIEISRTLLRLNSVFNPVLYCFKDLRFRKAVLELLKIRKTQAAQKTGPNVQFRQQKNQHCLPGNV